MQHSELIREPELSSTIMPAPHKSPSASAATGGIEITGAALGPPLPCTDTNPDARDGCHGQEAADSPSNSRGAVKKPESYFTLPVSEDLVDKRRVVAIFGPHEYTCQGIQSDGSSLIVRKVFKIEHFRDELRELRARLQGLQPVELWLFHAFLTDCKGQPLMGGRQVSENELYELLWVPVFDRVTVFQITFRLSCGSEPTYRYNASIRCNESVAKSICDIDFYLADIAGKDNWKRLYDALVPVVARASTEKALTGQATAAELVRCCPGLTLWQQSGVRSGRRVISQPERLVDSTEMPPPQQQDCAIVSKQPMQPDQDDFVEPCNPSHHQNNYGYYAVDDNMSRYPRRNLQLVKPTDNCNGYKSSSRNDYDGLPASARLRRNAAIGLIVGDYGSLAWSNREGAAQDKMLIYDISRKFCCADEDIIFNNSYSVTKQGIGVFIHDAAVRLRKMGGLQNTYLFTSAHGDSSGITTSSLDTVRLEELVLPLHGIGEHLVLFHQPCRGVVELWADGAARMRGLSLPDVDTAGCCLPPVMSKCSALIASLPGYSNSYHWKGGSFMLQSMREVACRSDLAGWSLNPMELTQMTVAKLFEMFPDYRDKVPMQYTMRGPCSISISDSHFRQPEIPEVGHPSLRSCTLKLRNN